MRNSSLVEGLCAENVTGLKHDTETTGSVEFRFYWAVGERSALEEGIPRGVLDGAEMRMSERVAIRQARNLFAVSLRFPGQG